jgi:hypothetical protein
MDMKREFRIMARIAPTPVEFMIHQVVRRFHIMNPGHEYNKALNLISRSRLVNNVSSKNKSGTNPTNRNPGKPRAGQAAESSIPDAMAKSKRCNFFIFIRKGSSTNKNTDFFSPRIIQDGCIVNSVAGSRDTGIHTIF